MLLIAIFLQKKKNLYEENRVNFRIIIWKYHIKYFTSLTNSQLKLYVKHILQESTPLASIEDGQIAFRFSSLSRCNKICCIWYLPGFLREFLTHKYHIITPIILLSNITTITMVLLGNFEKPTPVYSICYVKAKIAIEALDCLRKNRLDSG